MKAAIFYGTRDVRIEDVKVKDVSPGKIKIAVGWTGICGSDLHAYHHGIGVAQEVHPISGRKAPLIIGHEFSGTVVEIGEGVTKFKVGDKVAVEPNLHCGECESCRKGYYNLCDISNAGFIGLSDDGGFAEYTVADAKYFHKLPDNMSLEEGALVEPTAVAFHGVRKSGLKVGQSVAIFGAGPIGLLTLLCAQAAGAAKTFIVDISEERLNKAKELGATYTFNPLKVDVVAEIMEITGAGVDISFEAAGAQATMISAINSLKKQGTLLVLAAFASEIAFNPNDLLAREGNIIFSLAYANEYPEVINLISEGKLDVKQVITQKISLDNLVEQGLEVLLTDKSQSKILVSPKSM